MLFLKMTRFIFLQRNFFLIYVQDIVLNICPLTQFILAQCRVLFFLALVLKRSVARLPLVGLISKCLGCVYVQRESKSSEFKGVSGVITERILEANRNKSSPMMLFFPEGTTANGDYLLPFKTGAFLAKVPVLLVILRYSYKRFSPAWDTISGVRHGFMLLCQFVNYIEVIHLPVYYPSEEEKEDPKLYANNVRKFMAAKGNLIMVDIGLPEKRVYHAALNDLHVSERCKYFLALLTLRPKEHLEVDHFLEQVSRNEKTTL